MKIKEAVCYNFTDIMLPKLFFNSVIDLEEEEQ